MFSYLMFNVCLNDVSIFYWRLQNLSFTVHPYQMGYLKIAILKLFYFTLFYF
jgi:hypothetical protein